MKRRSFSAEFRVKQEIPAIADDGNMEKYGACNSITVPLLVKMV